MFLFTGSASNWWEKRVTPGSIWCCVGAICYLAPTLQPPNATIPPPTTTPSDIPCSNLRGTFASAGKKLCNTVHLKVNYLIENKLYL